MRGSGRRMIRQQATANSQLREGKLYSVWELVPCGGWSTWIHHLLWRSHQFIWVVYDNALLCFANIASIGFSGFDVPKRSDSSLTICKKAGWKKEWAWTSYSPFLPFFCSKFIHLPSFNPEFSSFSARWWREPNQNQRLVVSIWMLREKHRRSSGLKPDFPAECHKTLGYNLKF